MKNLILSILISASIVPEISAEENSRQPNKDMPNLIIMNLSDSSRSQNIDNSTLITSDSASIISPPVRTVIKNQSIKVEIMPRCRVDSVKVLLRHSEGQVDTLGVCRKPPYRITWNPEKSTDQDQLNLQFGYVLFHNSGLKIVSSAMPHRWVLDRDETHSRKKYNCFQITDSGRIKIDGDLSDWKSVRKGRLGEDGIFQMLWTGSHFLFAAHIYDESVTYSDFLEIHFDLYNDKSSFAGINHRSIRFGPKSRSSSFTVRLTDSGFIMCDSINVLLSREMKWTRSFPDDGYIIEASIPLFCLSDLQFPNLKFGFDVTLTDVDEGREGKVFTSWSGSSATNSHNPSQWGSVVLHQAMFPLKLALAISAIIIVAALVFMIIILIRQNRDEYRFEKIENRGYSELMNSIIETTRQQIKDNELTSANISSILGISAQEIEDEVQKEAECNFGHFVEFQRIKAARLLLKQPEIPLDEVAKKTGFGTMEEFNSSFVRFTRTSPEKYRERVLEEEAEDLD